MSDSESKSPPDDMNKFLFEKGQAFNIVVGPDAGVIDANRAALAILGYSKKEFVGRSVLESLVDEEREMVRDVVAHLEAMRVDEPIEAGVYAKDGPVHTIMFFPST